MACGARPESLGEEAALRMDGRTEPTVGEADLVAGRDEEAGQPTSCAVSADDDRLLEEATDSGLATRVPMVPSDIWLTSELALDRVRKGTSPFSSSGCVHATLMSSVKRDSMEKREERVPPVETSLSK